MLGSKNTVGVISCGGKGDPRNKIICIAYFLVATEYESADIKLNSYGPLERKMSFLTL